MTSFTFSPGAYAGEFREKGYLHVKNGVDREFLDFARRQLVQCRLTGANELPDRMIKNKKKQYLFDLPDGDDFISGLAETIGALTGLPADQITVSERHIMIYDDHAGARPPLHKDRLASQVAVGIPLDVSADARIVLLPHCAREINVLDRAVYCASSTDPAAPSMLRVDGGESPILEERWDGSLELVELDVQPGDVVFFAGCSMYHARFNSAQSAVLYLKINAMRLDPLSEDPSTVSQRESALKLLGAAADDHLLHSFVELSPRLLRVSRHYTRFDWKTVLEAYVSGEKEFAVSEEDLRFLTAVRGRRRVDEIFGEIDIPKSQRLSRIPAIRRLARLGAIDVLG